MLVSTLILSVFYANTATGGPDAYGYIWDDGVPFSWIDITGTGTDSGITGDDDSTDVSIGFNFNFYGNSYSTISISSNVT